MTTRHDNKDGEYTNGPYYAIFRPGGRRASAVRILERLWPTDQRVNFHQIFKSNWIFESSSSMGNWSLNILAAAATWRGLACWDFDMIWWQNWRRLNANYCLLFRREAQVGREGGWSHSDSCWSLCGGEQLDIELVMWWDVDTPWYLFVRIILKDREREWLWRT